jgi:copper resistance protein D
LSQEAATFVTTAAFTEIKVAVSNGNSSYYLTGNPCSSLLEACMINPWLDTFVLWVHILAAICWVGGMVFVAFVLGPYVRRAVPPESRTALMAAVGKRFSALGWSAIFTLVSTGIYNAIRFLGSWDALFGTTFGHILLVKIALVTVMIGLSIAHDFFLGPRQRDLGRLAHQTHRPFREPTMTPIMPVIAGASLADHSRHLEGSAASPEQAATTQAFERLRRWTILIAQLNLVLGVLVILLAASLQSF